MFDPKHFDEEVSIQAYGYPLFPLDVERPERPACFTEKEKREWVKDLQKKEDADETH